MLHCTIVLNVLRVHSCIIWSLIHVQTFGKIYFITVHRINRKAIDRLWTRHVKLNGIIVISYSKTVVEIDWKPDQYNVCMCKIQGPKHVERHAKLTRLPYYPPFLIVSAKGDFSPKRRYSAFGEFKTKSRFPI